MKVDRLVSIIMVLLDKKRISAQSLADMFEVSLRTIYRDIDAIDLAGIPIIATSGVGGGFEILPNYKLDKNVFSSSDLSTILTSLSNLSNMIQSEELINALAKIRNFIPPESTKEINLKANQIHIDLSSWIGNNNLNLYLPIIKKAIEQNKFISFDYTDRYRNKTKRIVEPYQLILKSRHWYFQGYCNNRNDYRLFRLSRMSNLEIKSEIFTPKDYQKPILDFTDILVPMQTKITLRIHNSIMDDVLDFCDLENFSPDGDVHHLVSFPFIENDYYYHILLGFGIKCECLAPLHIRTELQNRIRELLKIYEESNY